MSEKTPRGIMASLDELLRDPESTIARGHAAFPWRLLLGALAGLVLYGAAAGTFQGGAQVLVASFKAPVIVFGAMLLCLPSYYVFVTLAGARFSPRRLASHMAGFLGIVSLLFAALLPIAWLFSVSTRSVSFMGFLHFIAFLLALGFAARFLGRCHPPESGRAGLFPWVLLLLLVTTQVASQLRPLLFRPASTPIFAPEREFFLEHWGDCLDLAPISDEKDPGDP